MMETEVMIMLMVQGVFWGLAIVGIIYFGVQAYNRRKEEDFEDRDS